jgi:thioredoxin-like negative regulator of GroEL
MIFHFIIIIYLFLDIIVIKCKSILNMNQRPLLFFVASLLALLSLTVAKSIEINEENWETLLSEGEWMVEFFAPWCPACNRFESVWKELSDKSAELNIKVGAADVNANPVLSGLFSVTSLPTIYQ